MEIQIPPKLNGIQDEQFLQPSTNNLLSLGGWSFSENGSTRFHGDHLGDSVHYMAGNSPTGEKICAEFYIVLIV